MNIPSIKLIESGNNSFAATVDFGSYRVLSELYCYDIDVTIQLQKMAKKIAVQMKDRTLSRKYPTSLTTILQKIKFAGDASEMC